VTRHNLPMTERVASRVERVGECELWQGARDPDGYGIVKVDGKARRLTRVVWELHHGPIPAGLSVLHSCDHPSCARVDHLMLGTQRANIQDMLRKGRRPKHRAA
jgi:hypothetical protein